MNNETREMVLGIVAGIRGEKRAGMVKSAKNLTRLLARVGPDLAGATPRDLKFLARRGFTGFTPQQVQALRARGMLPSVEQELAGFNRGTERMLRGTEVSRTDFPGEAGYHLSRYPGGRSVAVIPPARPSASLAEQEARAVVGRHEAREWVRGNARRRAVRPVPDMIELAYSMNHHPGVMYDERVFRSQLANRLGFGRRWSELPVFDGYDGYFRTNPIYRGPRETYVGNKPLSYDFAVRRQWQKAVDAERARLRDKVQPRIDQHLPSLENGIRKIDSRLLDKGYVNGLTPDEVRRFFTDDVLGYDVSGIGQRLERALPPETMARMRELGNDYRYYDMYRPLVRSGSIPGYSVVRDVDRVLSSPPELPARMASGELARLRDMSPSPGFSPVAG